MQNNLIIDWGNTKVKLGIFNSEGIIQQLAFDDLNPEILANEIVHYLSMNILLCSVTHRSDALEAHLKLNAKYFIKLSHRTPIPLKIKYLSPETLGFDRLANAVAANKLTKNNMHSLCIDAGTCLKFDFVHAELGYMGGAISLGLSMRYKALNNYTAALPLITKPEKTALIGRNTIECIHSGVINGMQAEIKGIVAEYCSNYNDLTIYITGGDSHFFEKTLKNDIFAHVFLTLMGLNEILEFNKAP